MVVIRSKYAKLDLKNYKQNSNIHYKENLSKYIKNLILYVDTLKDFPLLGKMFYSYKNIEIRQLIYEMHRIFYYIQNETVIIIMVVHTSRDLTNIIKEIKRITK